MKTFIFILLFIFVRNSFSADKYYLCGPDEDGCPAPDYQYCMCIPENGALAQLPYCLHLDEKVICTPLSETPDCLPGYIMKNQSACLATGLQSEPDPPCPTVTEKFCIENHVLRCQPNGDYETCSNK